jgi:capsular polysaccharide biosynthesis protein
VAQRVSQTALESESQQTNVLLLGTAVPPTKPSGPKIVLNTVLSIFLGGLLGLGAAFVRELMDRRIRDVEDLLVIDGVPVIGVLEPKAKLGEILWRVAPARGLAGPQRALLAHIDGE